MRSEGQIIRTILSVAKRNKKIRTVILNGSRTNKNIIKDDFQDFDIIFLVENLTDFKNNSNWIDVFGERIILQMPNSMKIDEQDFEAEKEEITYLMLFKDFNRIDLKLIPIKNKFDCRDSLNKVLLDKDNLIEPILESTDEDYWIKKPTQKEFSDCCNEFWWVSTYVIKGLARNEILYAKEMLEEPIRKMFMRMIAWSVGTEIGFTINLGKSNRFLKKYVSSLKWERILKTYPDTEKINIWNSLIEMTNFFQELGLEVSNKLELNYNIEEAKNVNIYISDMEERIFK